MAVLEVGHETLREVLLISHRTQVATFVQGTMGIGKSEGVLEAAKALAAASKREIFIWNDRTQEEKLNLVDSEKLRQKYHVFLDIRLSQTDPTDMKGLPAMTGEHKTSTWLPPTWAKIFEDPEAHGTIFFDEMNLAPTSILAAAYQIIHDRQVGECRISPNVMIVAAGNGVDDNANIFDMPAPLKNRFIHIHLAKPTPEQWTSWAMDHAINSYVIGFINWKTSLLYAYDPKKVAADAAFPTPRTWVKLSKMIDTLGLDLSSSTKGIGTSYDLVQTLAAATVGEGTAVEFIAFLKVASKLNVLDFLKDPKLATKFTRTDVDKKWALISALVDMWGQKKPPKEFSLGKAAEIAEQFDPEFGVLLLRQIKANGEKTKDFYQALSNDPAWKRFAENRRKFIHIQE